MLKEDLNHLKTDTINGKEKISAQKADRRYEYRNSQGRFKKTRIPTTDDEQP